MPEILDLNFFLLAIPAVIMAGISKGGFGAGAAFVATPLLALILEPGAAIGLMLPLLMVMDVTALKPYWKKWDAPSSRALILGSIPGVLIATLLYSTADPNVFRLLIGVIAVGFVLFQLARSRGLIKPSARPMGPVGGVFWGLISGFTSFISHAGGPPAAVYLLSRSLSKTQFQATSVIVFWAINLFKFIPYCFIGIFSWQTAKADLTLLPFAFFGVWLGVLLHKHISERWFFAFTYLCLLITGSKLIFESLT